MINFRAARLFGAVAVGWVGLFAAGCSSHSTALRADGSVHDGGGDAPTVACNGANKMNGASGAACGCAGDCASGFCVDGVCCNSACTETCKSCNTAGAPGSCAFVPAGGAPRGAGVCPASEPSTCGLDGTCDGAGACRSFVLGTICEPGSCNGAAISGGRVCDGHGTCTAGPTIICAPFNCDPTTGSCAATCVSDNDCVSSKCVNGSCGPKPLGAICVAGSQCASGFCADGVCCNIACTGPCVSCAQAGRAGICGAATLGAADPHGICTPSPASSCGQSGVCDGIGGCSKYARETVCVAPSCSGDRINTAGTCDGIGACRSPGVQDCDPFQCIDGACVSRCQTDADCVSGHSCVNGTCGPKSNGQTCAGAGECASGFCVDGVCCADACQGACRSCALPSALGTCQPSAAGAADPRAMCVDQKAPSCGTDGTCDGAGGCRKYATGTVCAAETCASGIYTPAASCDANGNCTAPDAITCAPYTCNGSKCFASCATGAECSTGNICTASSCGLKPNGASCSTNAECLSATCAQGICCATACTGSCRSCAVAGSLGLCTDVPTGMPDPAGGCNDQGAASCGTNGKCAAGSCQKYVQGTSCQAATCPTGGMTFSASATCDGAGTCVNPAATSCAPYTCGAATCKATCTSNADCAAPAVCTGGSCGLKSTGAVCAGGTECKTGICAQGVCCATACGSTCMSCALTGSAGTCTSVSPGGTDPANQCVAQAAATCGTTGFCDGKGACQLYAAGTQCAAPTCPMGMTTATLARTCNGAGVCQPASTQSCAPFACSGTACVAVCSKDGDCAPGNVCNGGSCGLKRLGQACAMGSECQGGSCVDGVCCGTASCGTCAACNVAGSAGTCTPVVAGMKEPHGGCTAAPPCGFDGTCNGAGACRSAAAATSCGAPSCTAGTATSTGSCDGAGTCKQTTAACAPYVCGANACLTACMTNTDCAAGDTCQSKTCTNLSPNGTACTADTTCASGHCTESVCCGSSNCGSCNSCAVPGMQGICTPVPSGGADPAGQCQGMPASSCGTTGVCNGAGACTTYPDGTACAEASCDGNSGNLKGAAKCMKGNCTAGPPTSCAPYACDATAGACKISCASNADCHMMSMCALPDGGTVGTCM